MSARYVTKAEVEAAWDQFKALSRDGQVTVTSRLFGLVDSAWPRKQARVIAQALVEIIDSETRIESDLKRGPQPK